MKKSGLASFLILLLLASCAIDRMAIQAVSDALTGSGSADVFSSDSDPQLVGDALPFAIKLYEALLSQNPDHQGLLLTTGSLFVMYANAFVQTPAQMLDPVDFWEERIEALDRAKKLYLRGNAILYSALDKKYPGFSTASLENGTLQGLLARCRKDDVPLLYWTVASGLSAYSIDLFDFELGSNIPKWSAMIARAYHLDQDFQNGAIDEFYILFYGSMPEYLGGDRAMAEKHFNLALEKSRFLSAGPYVAYATAVCVGAQDYDGFRANLQKALEIDPEDDPSIRLLNILSQRRARHLLENAHDFF
ncbi:MAG: TRAP transporter TatT component family protein [Treponema sp.]|nr:TRAP transporter TatT component family protein [Treponema sp.]